MLDEALRLAELGYSVFPCSPGSKKPYKNSRGLLEATTDEAVIGNWFTKAPESNLAIRTDGIVVLDLDPVDGKPNTWLHDDPEKAYDLACAPLSVTPRGGRHYLFRQPEGADIRNDSGRIAPGVDVRANGGYILVAPSNVDGKSYSWPLGELDCKPSALPLPPKWLLELLERKTPNISTRLTNAKAANRIPDGQRNSALTSLGGVMRRAGMGFGEILAALLAANNTRCTPPLDASEVETIARSCAQYEPDAMSVAIVESHAAQDGVEGLGLDVAGDGLGAVRHPGKFPLDLLDVPGFIGDVIKYNLAGAYKPQPILALAGAICLLSVLTGRKISDEYNTRTNLYIIGVAESTSGKERARDVNEDILHLASASKLIGPGGIASSAGLTNTVYRQNAVLLQVDEIGRMLKTMSGAAAEKNPHLYNIASVLLKLFTHSHKVYHGDAYADAERNVEINYPHCVLYGTTVPKSLYESFSADSITDGFMSRLMILESEDPDPEELDNANAPKVPDLVIKAAQYWHDLRPLGGNNSDQCPIPHQVPYTDEARARMSLLRTLGRAEKAALGQSGLNVLWGRAIEKARKLALLYACSAQPFSPEVTYEAADWACRLTEYSIRKLLFIASEYVAENSQEAKHKRILRTIRECRAGISTTMLWRSCRWLPAKERDQFLNSMLANGEIVMETSETGGRAATIYRAV